MSKVTFYKGETVPETTVDGGLYATSAQGLWINDGGTKVQIADLTPGVVSTSTNGLMSASDKSKLDGIASGANKTTVDSSLSSTSTNPVQNKVVNSALSGKVPTTRTVNGKALSSNITLGYGDVGAAAASHSHNDLYYTEAEVDAKIDAIVGEGAAESLDTIGEISAALKNNAGIIDTLNAAIGNKQATITGAATTITSSNLTANCALVSNGSGKVAASGVTSTELGYLDGVTSGIQSQLDAKVNFSDISKLDNIIMEDKLIWDGNVSGIESVTIKEGVAYIYKVSPNAVTSASDCAGKLLGIRFEVDESLAPVLGTSSGIIVQPISEDMISQGNGYSAIMADTDPFIVFVNDSSATVQISNGSNVTLTRGTWFMYNDMSALVGATYKIYVAAIMFNNDNGDMISIESGGTSATNVEDARANLGVYSKEEIDSQLNNIDVSIKGAASSIKDNNLTANMALVSNASGKVAVSSNISATELGYLEGVTSNVQTQLNNKASSSTITSHTTNADIHFTAAERTKLANIDAYANKYILPMAGSTLGGVKTISNVTDVVGYSVCPIVNGVVYYKDTKNFHANAITSGTLEIARGGTGLVSNPVMVIDLGSTTAANVFAVAPRPGITGTLDISHGGTGATTAEAARTNLGITAITNDEIDQMIEDLMPGPLQ